MGAAASGTFRTHRGHRQIHCGYDKRTGRLVAKSCGRDGLGGGEEGEGARVCVYEGERATTYGNSDGGRRRRGSAGEQAVQSAQDRMEYDAHGGALTTVKQYYRFENDEITPL